jgi:hypothetical protein
VEGPHCAVDLNVERRHQRHREHHVHDQVQPVGVDLQRSKDNFLRLNKGSIGLMKCFLVLAGKGLKNMIYIRKRGQISSIYHRPIRK